MERHSENPDRMQTELQRLNERYQRDMTNRQNNLRNPTSGIFTIIKYIIGLAGLAAFFLLYRKWLLKLAILGVSSAAFVPATTFIPFFPGNDMFMYMYGMGGMGRQGPGFIPIFFGFLTLVIIIIGLALYSLKPNLVLIIKTKIGVDGATPIKIQRSRGFWAWRQDSDSGFAEVFPTDEAEGAIREINAMIGDIQKLGDQGVQKWLNM